MLYISSRCLFLRVLAKLLNQIYIRFMSRKNLTLLKMLLVAVMVFQPVVSAYAMATMGHASSSVTTQAMLDHKMDHGMMRQTMGENASPASMGDCCASSATCPMMACSVALLQDALSVATITTSLVIPAYQISWAGISLPTEIRPPRNILS